MDNELKYETNHSEEDDEIVVEMSGCSTNAANGLYGIV